MQKTNATTTKKEVTSLRVLMSFNCKCKKSIYFLPIDYLHTFVLHTCYSSFNLYSQITKLTMKVKKFALFTLHAQAQICL